MSKNLERKILVHLHYPAPCRLAAPRLRRARVARMAGVKRQAHEHPSVGIFDTPWAPHSWRCCLSLTKMPGVRSTSYLAP